MAQLELARFLRRPMLRWLCAACAAVAAAALIGAALLLTLEGRQLDLPEALVPVVMVTRLLLTLEAVALAALAYLLAAWSLRQELECGSLGLLAQAPLDLTTLLAGKAIGVGACLLLIHSFLTALLLAPTPFLRRSHAEVLLEVLLVWVFALGYLPEGLAASLARQRRDRSYLVLRLASLARVAVPLAVLHLLILPRSAAAGVGIWDVVAQLWLHLADPRQPPCTVHFSSPLVPVAVVVGWQLLSAAALWRWVTFIAGRPAPPRPAVTALAVATVLLLTSTVWGQPGGDAVTERGAPGVPPAGPRPNELGRSSGMNAVPWIAGCSSADPGQSGLTWNRKEEP